MPLNTYKVLTPDEVITYVRTALAEFSTEQDLSATRLSGDSQSVDGRVNVITAVRSASSGKAVIVKQMMPYFKASESELYPLALERFSLEVNSLKIWDSICPGAVPKVYLWDDANKILLMEDLGRLKILSYEILRRKYFPKLPQQLGNFLGKTAFYTSDLFLTHDEIKKLKNMFTFNTKRLWNNFLFTLPILQHKHNQVNPSIQNELAAFCSNPRLRQEVIRLSELYQDKRQCLIHSDLHISNILVDSQELIIFDTEYANYGPISIDISRVLSSFALSYAALFGQEMPAAERQEYQAYLLSVMAGIYQEFIKTFHAAWQQHLSDNHDYQSPYNRYFRKSLLQETLGFAACAAVGRIYDNALTFDFKQITDLEQRAVGQRYIIRLAEALLLHNRELTSITDLIQLMESLAMSASLYKHSV